MFGTTSRRAAICAALSEFALGIASPAVHAQVIGTLDPSFGTGGQVQFDINNTARAVEAMALSPVTGQIIAGGQVSAADPNPADAFVFRLQENGALDTSFGVNGIRTINAGTNESVADLAVRSDGRIVAVIGFSANNLVAVAQLTANGALDTGFAGDGVAELNLGGAFGDAVALQPADGKIVIGAWGYGDVQFRVARVTTAGVLDTTFNAAGAVPGVANVDPTVNTDTLSDVAVQPADGKIVAVGTANSSGFGSNTDFGVARFNANGTLDTSFGTNGVVLIDFDNKPNEPNAVVIQADGKIVVAGTAIRADSTSRGDFAVARLNTNGSLDTTFDGDGRQRVPFSGLAIATDVLVQSDGKIVLGGTQQESLPQNFALARLTANGALDPTFIGLDFYAYPATQWVSFGGYPPDRDDEATAIAQQSDGNYVLAGSTTYSDTDFAFARFFGETPVNYVNGTAGDDNLEGTPGNDYIDGKGGADEMSGLGGDDTYVVNNAGDTAIEGAGAGTDTVRSSVTFTLPIYVENLVLTGTAAINGSGNGLANTLTGNGANNVLNGKAGADVMAGKAGNDTYFVDHTGDKVTEGADQGTDLVKSSVSHTLKANVENLTLIGNAAISGTGNTQANKIAGNGGANTLNGKTGNDTLTGAAGQDQFLFNTAPGTGNIDTIADFVPADDTIRLENAVFTGLPTTGTLAAAAFATGTAATTAAHRIIYDPATGDLRYDADGVGGAPAARFATLSTKPALTRADFVVQ